MCEGIHTDVCKESDMTEHAYEGITHEKMCVCVYVHVRMCAHVRARAHTHTHTCNSPGKDELTCEIHRPLENISRHNHKKISTPENLR